MKLLDYWITGVAKKDFSETINWIEAMVVGLLGILLAVFIYLDMTPIDITIPVKILGGHQFAIEQDYIDALPKKNTILLKNHDKTWKIDLIEQHFNPPKYIVFTTRQPIPVSKSQDWRLIVHQKTILEMLLKTKFT